MAVDHHHLELPNRYRHLINDLESNHLRSTEDLKAGYTAILKLQEDLIFRQAEYIKQLKAGAAFPARCHSAMEVRDNRRYSVGSEKRLPALPKGAEIVGLRSYPAPRSGMLDKPRSETLNTTYPKPRGGIETPDSRSYPTREAETADPTFYPTREEETVDPRCYPTRGAETAVPTFYPTREAETAVPTFYPTRGAETAVPTFYPTRGAETAGPRSSPTPRSTNQSSYPTPSGSTRTPSRRTSTAATANDSKPPPLPARHASRPKTYYHTPAQHRRPVDPGSTTSLEKVPVLETKGRTRGVWRRFWGIGR